MSYTNAPATILVNTACCACRRPLVDAQSVTLGIGPECRAKVGIPDELSEEQRQRANSLAHFIAADGTLESDRWLAIHELAAIGCDTLAEKLIEGLRKKAEKAQARAEKAAAKAEAKRKAKGAKVVIFGHSTETYGVRTPYSAAFVADVREIRGRRWDPAMKVWTVPALRKAALWTIVRRHFAGEYFQVENGEPQIIPALDSMKQAA